MRKGARSRMRLPSHKAPPWGRMASPKRVMTRDLARGGGASRKLSAQSYSERVWIICVILRCIRGCRGQAAVSSSWFLFYYAVLGPQAELRIKSGLQDDTNAVYR